jgi:arsenical pump membrane protein
MFKAGWMVLVPPRVGFFDLAPLGLPVSAGAAVGIVLLLAAPACGPIDTRKVLKGAPGQIVVSLLRSLLRIR